MAHRQHFSKSTKRRRFLEEVSVVDLFRESPVQTSVLPPVKNISIHNINNSHAHTQPIMSQSSCSNNDLYTYYDLEENEILNSSSNSDSDNTEEISDIQYSSFNFCNDDTELILKGLAQWAVSYNINNIALSALLKSLKSHKCFNKFPVDARTILKISKTNHSLNI